MAENIDIDILRTTVCDFFANELPPAKVREMDESAELSEELWSAVGRLGWFGLNVREEFGGANSTCFAATILNEELAKRFASLAADYVLVGMIARLLDELGTVDQQQQWLPGVVT